jgi:predicted pyridoxine 5'-phosphate oxidase superfamily flavin-nucleotide-binding protein
MIGARRFRMLLPADCSDGETDVIRDRILPAAYAFLVRQTMVVVGAKDPEGRVWSSLLTGPRGFLCVRDEQTIAVGARPVPADPLATALHEGDPVGLLAIEFEIRRRMRINGRIAADAGDGFTVHVEEACANCPKYIPAHVRISHDPGDLGRERRAGIALDQAQQQWIEQADTFFIASFHAPEGADVSHRGGRPGFVRILDSRALEWPDYAGNNLFQALGNLAAHPRAGLLLVDFGRGRTLPVTGRAETHWAADRVPSPPETGRSVRFQIDGVIESATLKEGLP